ncbi:unnamed protein product [Dovyalis caffra]|uniref:Uncharacterized protein n=1 Tax=Dovyalis caffra TaxID=77055 RepID=A0AAV1RA29_9ROSI|nr:unnamed protein product [Dovyalis caffra]
MPPKVMPQKRIEGAMTPVLTTDGEEQTKAIKEVLEKIKTLDESMKDFSGWRYS